MYTKVAMERKNTVKVKDQQMIVIRPRLLDTVDLFFKL